MSSGARFWVAAQAPRLAVNDRAAEVQVGIPDIEARVVSPYNRTHAELSWLDPQAKFT